ncbi:glycosyltransferase [Motilibacter deserti]|uniref:Glycosyltransferase family 1 protein n=1 Tax=Motilibacter deserti TaxID=2714956 RepID=A0ABX0GY33_9ACTN|nr:glycosyltransferase [Motilibacter deserti]NHC14148.1 glycosyltransferase family 1 protein [Motilibacter deserti]
MKIAMVSEHASPLASIGGVDSGGQNVHVAALAAALARRGHEVTVYTRRDSPALPDRVEVFDGYAVEHLAAGPPAEIPKDDLLPHMSELASGLAARFAVDRPDVVHGHFWMSGLAALLAAQGTGVPVVQTFHALGTVKRRHQGAADTSPEDRVRVERAVCHDASRIIATCSDEVFELVRMGARRTSVSVVPCGVDVDHFTPTGPTMELPTAGMQYRLLVVGRLVARKGVDDVIRALASLRNTELIVAGGPEPGDLDSDPEVRRLREVAAGHGVADRVLFLGRVGRPQMPALLRSADLLVTVPWYEPFGIVPLEAMACGLPVVASAVGGLQDTVVDGTTGALVPPHRPDVLAQMLRHLLADPMRREGYGLAGIDRARARYNWDRIALDTEAVYADVVRGAPAQARAAGVEDDEDLEIDLLADSPREAVR